MKDFDKRFNRMQTVVTVFIGLVFTLIVCWFIFIAVMAVKVASAAESQDWSGGVKPVIEKMWCGKPGCLGL